MVRRTGLIFIFLFFLVHQALAGWDPLDYVTYYGTTDQDITFGWNPAADGGTPTSYDWRVYHVERKAYVMMGNTPDSQKTIWLPRTGHYKIEVRARNAAGTSQWIMCTDPAFATVNGQPRAWWIYGHVAGPGDIIIE